MYIVLVPFLPVLVSFKYLKYKYFNGRHVKYTISENLVPTLFSTVFGLLVFLWPFFSEEWSTAQDVVDFLTVVLQFLLPLQVTAAIARNKLAMESYRKFTSKMLQVKKFQNNKLIKYMAKAMKWKFRDKVDPCLLFGNEQLEQEYKNRQLPDALIDDVYKGIIQMKADTAQKTVAISLIKEAQGAYGEIKSSAEFKVPNLFISFFYLCMCVYFFLLPYTFHDNASSDRVFKCMLYLYVFLGMFNISIYISDPFMSGTKGMQTVTEIEKIFNSKVGYTNKECKKKVEIIENPVFAGYTPIKLKI